MDSTPNGNAVKAKVIAKQWDLGVSTVYELGARGIIPCIRIGNSVRFDPQAVADALSRQSQVEPENRATP